MKDTANIVGARIAGRPTYTPAHQIPGVDKVRSAKVEFNVMKNHGQKKVSFRVTAWGGMADAIARGGAPGKEISFTAEILPFEGRVWMPMADGSHQFVTKPDGTPLKQWKTGYTIMDIHWGADGAKTKANEIASGMRPAGWDQHGTPDHNAWLQICATRNAAQFINGSTTFEYADVDLKNLPQGAQIVMGKVANNAAPVAPVVQQPVQQVQAPVVVNGQNMGYAMPVQAAEPVQHVANPAAVQQTIPAQPVQPVQPVQTGYAQQAAPAPGGYSPITM